MLDGVVCFGWINFALNYPLDIEWITATTTTTTKTTRSGNVDIPDDCGLFYSWPPKRKIHSLYVTNIKWELTQNQFKQMLANCIKWLGKRPRERERAWGEAGERERKNGTKLIKEWIKHAITRLSLSHIRTNTPQSNNEHTFHIPVNLHISIFWYNEMIECVRPINRWPQKKCQLWRGNINNSNIL